MKKSNLDYKKIGALIIINCIVTGTISYVVAADMVLDSKDVSYIDNYSLGVDNVQKAIDATCDKVNTVQSQVDEINTTLSTKQDKLSSSLGTMSSNSTLISSTIASSSSTYSNVRSLTLPAGKYIISYSIAFPTNATGWRSVGIKVGDSGSSTGVLRVGANPNGYTNLSTSLIANLTSESTVYLVAQQVSGSNMTLISSGLWALRVW